MRTAVTRHIGPIAVLAACAMAYCWPLVSHLRTAMPGGPSDLDVATFVWNVGYVQHALSTGGSLLHTEDVLVPFGADLRLHTYGVLQGLAVAPLVGLLGVVGAFNVTLLGTLVLNGVCLYALTLREAGSRAAAMVAAVCFMLAAPLLDQLDVGRPTFASLWIVALALLVLRMLLVSPRWWHGVALGALLVAALLTDFQVALFAALWLAVYGAWRVRPRHLAVLALGAVVAGVVLAAVFLPAFGAEPLPTPSLDDMREYSFRVVDAVDPSVVEHLFGLEFLAAAVLLRRRSTWLVGALLFTLLSLGPYLQPTSIPLPFAAFSVWSPLAQFRTPYRMAMPAALGGAVMLAVVLAPLLGRWRASIRSAVAAVLVVARVAASVAWQPLATQTYPSYALYSQLHASQPATAVLLEVPFGIRSGLERIGNGGEVLELYQSSHGMRLLNGMIARLPQSVFSAYRAHPALLVLGGEDVSASPDDLRAVLDWTGARYVLVHRSMLDQAQLARIDALLGGTLELQTVEGDLQLYVARSM